MKLLIVGAQRGSLGEAVAARAEAVGMLVVTAGISRQEEESLDIRNKGEMVSVLREVDPDAILCTAGINRPPDTRDDFYDWMHAHWRINCLGVLELLQEWMRMHEVGILQTEMKQFVAVSSNSAHIARRFSAAYCASKAALSMGIRVISREAAEKPGAPVIYAWEPGLLADTPMTTATSEIFGVSGAQMTRMPGLQGGIPASVMAMHIVHGLYEGGKEMNGLTIRLDAGEQ